jgi:hypothetical protein
MANALVIIQNLQPQQRIGDLRFVSQFTFAHDTLMWLVHAFHAILELTIILRQFFSNDVRPAWNVLATGGSKKYRLTDLEFISRHRLSHQMSEDCRASQANDQEFQRSCLTVIWFNVVDSHIQHRCDQADDEAINAENKWPPLPKSAAER